MFLCVAISVFGTPATAQWAQFRGDPAHGAFAPGIPHSVLVPLWRTTFPAQTVNEKSYASAVSASPVVSGGTVFVGNRNTRLYALDARTGSVLWEYAAGAPIESTPLVHDGRVYVLPVSGALAAISTAGGPPLWITTTGGSQDRSSPALSGENVVVGSTFPSRDIVAVNRLTGQPAWRYGTSQFVFSSPAVDMDGRIICGANDGRLYALTANGLSHWATPFQMLGSILRASPSLGNGKAYISGGEYDWWLQSVDISTGLLVWTAPMTPQPALPIDRYRGIQVSSPAVDGSFLSIVGGYGRAGLGPSTLYAFQDEGTSASVLWSVDIPNSVGEGYVSSPALTTTSVIVGTADSYASANPSGRLYAVDRATGTPRWYSSAGPVLSSPAVVDDLVLVGDMNGGLSAWQAVPAGDVDDDDRVTALDAQVLMAPAASDGTTAPHIEDRADLHPTQTPRADGSRSFGNRLITPADVERVLNRAVGLEPVWP